MVRVQRSVVLLSASVLVAIALFGGCQQQPASVVFGWKPVFGGLSKDSPVIAHVGEVAITQADLEQFIKEQPERMQADFVGPDGETVALHRMVDQSLLVLGAVDRKLLENPDVVRAMVGQRRVILDKAMRNFGLLRDAAPSEAQLKDYYEKHIESFKQLGLVRARHIQTDTKAEADRAWLRLQGKGKNDDWVHVCEEFSTNLESKKQSGDAGWMNEGGVTPMIADEGFATVANAMKTGLNPPIQIGAHWHIIEITHREFERTSTFEEAKEAVKSEMMPGFQDNIIKDYLKSARTKYSVKLEGRFASGQGATAQQLFERARVNTDPLRQIELLTMIADDYPESDRADDALFMAGNVALDNMTDRTVGRRLLKRLVDEYPNSDLADDAQVLIENLGNPKFMNPTSIEDLKH